MRNKSINLIVKPTHECDLCCEYCYDRIEKKNVNNKFITDEIIKEIALKACRAFENINWIWHGGEPSLAGIDFYKKNIEEINKIADKYNSNIKFSMQSNGNYLSSNKEMLEELRKLKVDVSFSLDFTNQNIYRSSKKQFENILSTVKKYDFPIINVINYEDFNNLIDNYKELESKNIKFMFNKRFNGNETNEQIDEMILNYIKYLDFIFWECPDIKDRTVKDLILSVIGSKNVLCSFENCIGNFINVNPDGDIFPCDRYGKNNSKKYNFMNIKDLEFSFIDYLNSDILKSIIKDNHQFINENCKKCDVYQFCNGGCKANRVNNGNIDLTKRIDGECRFIKEIILYIFNLLFNLKKEDFLKLNSEIYSAMFENNFVTKEIIELI